jgi:NADPH-dependent 2,4-dienoyl-CoA reductase/sulfur reductase-like enzyme
MNCLTRRGFGCLAGATCLAALAPHMAFAQSKGRVVVIGGGVGGTTVAKYLATSSKGIDVTLVEPKHRYTTCFFSNLYLADLRSFESLTHTYEALSERHGIKVIHDWAVAIDPAKKTVRLKGGRRLPYDRLVVAPGIGFRFDAIEGYDEIAASVLPHAWVAGRQTKLLKRQLQAMPDGGLFVIVAPPDPFRCPPGPYERASMMAYYFKRHKPRSKIIILDAKDSFFEQDLFQEAWSRLYPGMIEWLPAQFTGGVKSIDAGERVIKTASDRFKPAVANIIPPQMAGSVARQAGLANESGWCPVDPSTFESTLQPGIHLVGDAITLGDMPISAYTTNSQAKACAFAIAAALSGTERPVPRLFNTCFTFLAADDAVADAISFKLADGTVKIADLFITKVEASAEERAAAVRQAEGWYKAFTHDMFG